MVIRQGDVFWANLPAPAGSGPGYRRPVVVVQNDVVNRTRIRTVIACMLTTNLRLAHAPGNVLLGKREGNVPKRSVVNVTQIMTVDKMRLTEKIGTLSKARVMDILGGIYLQLNPMETS